MGLFVLQNLSNVILEHELLSNVIFEHELQLKYLVC